MVLGSGFLTKADSSRSARTVDKILNKVGAPSPTRDLAKRLETAAAGAGTGRQTTRDPQGPLRRHQEPTRRRTSGTNAGRIQDDFDKDLKDAQDRLAAANAKAADARERRGPAAGSGAARSPRSGRSLHRPGWARPRRGRSPASPRSRMGGGQTARGADGTGDGADGLGLQKDILDWWKNQGVVFT